ncbi:MAG: acyl-CoA dehydrogenase family protein [Planctomycetota bacterium]|jgi:alkylation response protein AidB-like acyl-CoA dehydrogenase
MDFEITPEEQAVKELARDFARDVCGPGAAERDKAEAWPGEPVKKAAELGLMGMVLPEKYGGTELGNRALSLALMEINKVDASVGVILSVHNSLCCSCVNHWANEETKQKFLPRLAAGEWLGAYALSESGAGSDAGSLRCKAVKDGDHYVLTGTKAWITSGDRADLMVVFARTDPDAGNRGVTAFAVETDSPGFVVGKKEPKLGIRASSTAEVILDGCRVPSSQVLGEVNKGFRVALHTLDGGRIGIACQGHGIMEGCLEASIAYAKERVQFGRPIAEFQPVQWKLAEMSERIQASYLLIMKAATLKDQGVPHVHEAATAKRFASVASNWCAKQAVQIHGGAGYCTDFPVERFFRDARITEIYEGTTEICTLVMARNLLRE